MYIASIAESINRILRTPLGSRVMRPEFGSRLYELRDREYNDEFKLDAARFSYEAIKRDEPRVKVERIISKVEPIKGVVMLEITLDNGNILGVEV